MKALIARDSWINKVLGDIGDWASLRRSTGLLAIAVGRWRLRLLGIEWQKGYSIWALWRM